MEVKVKLTSNLSNNVNTFWNSLLYYILSMKPLKLVLALLMFVYESLALINTNSADLYKKTDQVRMGLS